MNKNEKLKKITADQPSNWLEEAAKKIANKGARKNARKVALRVLQLLRERGISQTELAERMSVSRQMVTKIVKGQENFTFETIDKLERALDTTLLTIGEPAEESNHMARLTTVLSVPSAYSGHPLSQYEFPDPTVMAEISPFGISGSFAKLASNFDVPFRRQLKSLTGMNLAMFAAQLKPLPWHVNGSVVLRTISSDTAFSEVYRISEQEFLENGLS